jgi:hypothetical protein
MKTLKLIQWLKVARAGQATALSASAPTGVARARDLLGPGDAPRAKNAVPAREKHAGFRGPTDECTRPA